MTPAAVAPTAASSVLVSLLVIVTVLLLVPHPAGLRTQQESDPAPDPISQPGQGRPDPVERALLTRLRPVLAATAAGGGWAMVGGSLGVLAAVGCGVAAWVVLGRTEEPAVVRRREALVEDLPTGVDLLAACLDAGAAPESALLTVSRALGGPVGEEFLAIHHRLGVGVDPAQVWRSVSRHEQLGPLGRAVGRAHDTGAPVARAVHQLAEELRDRSRADVEARARSIEVKAAAPLGVCLLPAFVLLGVVPMVVGVFASMRLFQ